MSTNSTNSSPTPTREEIDKAKAALQYRQQKDRERAEYAARQKAAQRLAAQELHAERAAELAAAQQDSSPTQTPHTPVRYRDLFGVDAERALLEGN